MQKPFIYIASVRRTGSKMLAELLSEPPSSFIFREPRLVKGRLCLTRKNIPNIFAERGIDLFQLSIEMRARQPEDAVHFFRTYLEQNQGIMVQVGVKEIQHKGFEIVSNAFPAMKVIVTARDPRDIYLSMYHRRDHLAAIGRPWADPEILAENVNEEFQRIITLIKQHDSLIVRYEDLVTKSSVLQGIRTFAESDTSGQALLGMTSPEIAAQHGNQVRQTRTQLWRTERDSDAIAGSKRAFALMREYAEFFGYTP